MRYLSSTQSVRAVLRSSATRPVTQIARAAALTREVHQSVRIPAITSSQARRRPLLQPNHQKSPPASLVSRNIYIQTQSTPNASALKFLPNHNVLPQGFPSTFLEYTSPRATLAAPHPSPLAARLLDVDGVSSVFYGPDFITVTKAEDVNWAHIKPEVFSLITEAITSGEQIVNTVDKSASAEGQEGVGEDSLAPSDDDDEVVAMIKELLETRIRPAIQEDGGDIEFRGFENGVNGIESMLMHYIEEVKGVNQVLDAEEEIAMSEFAKFEEKLRQQKGPGAAPTTVGKGSLDFAE